LIVLYLIFKCLRTLVNYNDTLGPEQKRRKCLFGKQELPLKVVSNPMSNHRPQTIEVVRDNYHVPDKRSPCSIWMVSSVQ